jgi:hypothetical protein
MSPFSPCDPDKLTHASLLELEIYFGLPADQAQQLLDQGMSLSEIKELQRQRYQQTVH